MKAKSINGESPEEIKTALQDSMADGFKPTLAIVFISIKQDRNVICKLLTSKGIDIIGATSCGLFINDYEDNYEGKGSTVVLLLDIDKNNYLILFEDIADRSLEDAAGNLVKSAFRKFKRPAFILLSTFIKTDGGLLDGEGMVACIEKLAGPDITLFGGMAGDDLSFSGTWVFTNDKSTDYGMAVLLLDENKVELQGLAFSGWKPMGVSRTITESEDNLIYSIDNRPALEVYLHLLGQEINSADDQIDFFDKIGVHYPFQIERKNREPKMCAPIGYDKEKGALICESNVVQGSKFRFSTPPDFDIVETVIEKADVLKNETGAEAEAMLIFSCAGRFSALGPMAKEENDGLAKTWNAPMAGFYTYGEYGKGLNGKHEFHSTTCSWVVIKEK